MLQNRDPAHYLKPIVSTNTPKRLLWLDCATRPDREQGLMVQRWAGGALGTTHFTSRKGEQRDATKWYATLADMWDAVDEFCLSRRRSVLFAYDLATQLRVSAALIQLPSRGWTLNNIVLERTSAWARFTDEDRTLLCCDLRSWAPVEFGRFATDVEIAEPRSGVIPAGREFLARRHIWRAGVVRRATLQILDWIEAENLGPFRPTGSGQSYGAYRRRFMSDRLLVHDDMIRLEAERIAMHAGRCEAWRHGKLSHGPYVEYDMQAAYATIARDCEVPTVAVQEIRRPTVKTLLKAMTDYAVLARVTVTTEVACVPTKSGGRTVWPVGTFQTWLWDPELSLAFAYADHVEVHHVYKYKRAPALQKFATWVLDNMGDQTQIYGLVPRRVLKHWSRCLVGRLGLRYRSWEKFGTCPEPDLHLVTYIDVDEGTSTDLLCAGNDRFILSDMMESLDSLPQVPSWVASECRRRLWGSMCNVGLQRVVYVDTDSMIMDTSDVGPSTMDWLNSEQGAWSTKGQYRRMTIHGPRNYTGDNARHVAGLPLTARQTAPLEFTGQVMRSIKESMRAGQLDCVASIPRKFVLDSPDLRREHLPGGYTAPYRVQLPTITEDE